MSEVTGAIQYDRDSGVVSGWLYDRADLTRSHRVEVAIDGVPAATVSANLLIWGGDRPFDAIWNGFQFTIPALVRSDARLHSVEVRSSEGVELSGSPFLVENASDNPALQPQFLLVDRDPLVLREPGSPEAGADYVQLAPPESVIRPTGRMASNEYTIGGVWGHQAYQPYRQYIAYMRDVFVDPVHGNVFNLQGELWSGCHYLRNTDVIAEARSRIVTAPEDIPYIDRDVLTFAESAMQNYWHWHSDCLPALTLARSLIKDDYQILAPPLNTWQKQSAEMLLGAPLTETESLVRARGVYVTGHLDGRSIYPDAAVMGAYERLQAAAGCPSPNLAAASERVFVSRKDAGGVRLLENEDELVDALQPYGFKSWKLAELDYADKIRLFAKAEMIVGSHGAGLSNLGFAPPGASVFEIIRAGGLVGALRYMAVRAGLNHFWYSVDDEQAVRLDVPAFMTFFKTHARL